MLEIRITALENPIVFDDMYVNVLQIHNKKMFLNIVNHFHSLISYGEESDEIALLKTGKIIDFRKNVEMIFDVYNYNFNDKKITNKIVSKLSSRLEGDIDNFCDIKNLLSKLYQKITFMADELLDFVSFNVEVGTPELFKFFSPTVEQKEMSFFEKIVLILDLNAALKLFDILIFVNLKSFMAKDELIEFYRICKFKNASVLLIENAEDEICKYEKKNIVDSEFIDYVIK